MKTGPKPRTAQQAFDLVNKLAVRNESGCLIYSRGYPVGFGYRYIRADGKEWYVHRLVFALTRGWLPEVVRHKCDTPTCIEPDHLVAGTHVSNVADMVSKKRHNFGSRNGKAKLTLEQVREIRNSPLNYAELSRIYGISRGGIKHIKDGVNWKEENLL